MTMEELEIYDNVAPQRPIVESTVFESILSNEPTEISDSKVINKEVIGSLISCTDRDSDTKVCTVSEWTKPNTPYKRVAESESEVSKYMASNRVEFTFKVKKAAA